MAEATVMFGSDPEFFLAHRTTGLPVPAVGLIGGTKDKPRMVAGYGLQEDNVMAEFTTPPDGNIRVNMVAATEGVNVVLRNLVRGAPPCELLSACSVEFAADALDAAGPQARQFGCSPDFDAYNMGARHTRVDPRALLTPTGAWRFAGGHIHVGYKNVTEMPEYVAALMCDLTLGLSLVLGGEVQGQRRSLYGMAGRFRPTSYGVEYRTPSNQWLYRHTLQSYLSVSSGGLVRIFRSPQETQVRLFNEVPWADVQHIINNELHGEARAMLSWLGRVYPELQLDAVL
jgi:hypothetical protein